MAARLEKTTGSISSYSSVVLELIFRSGLRPVIRRAVYEGPQCCRKLRFQLDQPDEVVAGDPHLILFVIKVDGVDPLVTLKQDVELGINLREFRLSH